MKSKRVLMVDDSAMAARHVLPRFEALGYEVVTAASRQQLRWSLLEGVPEIVLMNGSVSRVDLVKLSRDIRRHPGGVDVLIVAFGAHEPARRAALAQEGVQLLDAGANEQNVVVDVVLDLLANSRYSDDIAIADEVVEVSARREHLTPIAPSSRSPMPLPSGLPGVGTSPERRPMDGQERAGSALESAALDENSVWDDANFKAQLEREKQSESELHEWDRTPLSAGVVLVSTEAPEHEQVGAVEQTGEASSPIRVEDATDTVEELDRQTGSASSVSSGPELDSSAAEVDAAQTELTRAGPGSSREPSERPSSARGTATPMPGSTRVPQRGVQTPARAGRVRMPSSRRRPASLQPPAMRRPGGEPSTPPPSGETPPVSSSAGKQLATNLRHQMRYLTQCSEHEALGVRRDSSQQHIEAAFARLIEQFESPPYSSSELATVSMLVRRIIDHLTRAYRRMMQEAASDPDYRDGQPLADPLWLTPDESTVPSSLPKTPVTRKTPKPSAVTSGDPRRRPSSAVQPAAVAKRMTPASERSQQRRSPKVKTSVPSSRRSPRPASQKPSDRTPAPESVARTFRRSQPSLRRSRVAPSSRANPSGPASSTPPPLEVENTEESSAKFFSRGMAALEAGQLRDARNLFARAHRLNPTSDTEAFVEVAKALTMRNEDRDEALSLLKRAYKISRHELIKQLVLELQQSSSKSGRSGLGGIFRRKS